MNSVNFKHSDLNNFSNISSKENIIRETCLVLNSYVYIHGTFNKFPEFFLDRHLKFS